MFCISFNHKGMTTQNRKQYAVGVKEKAMLLEAVQQENTAKKLESSELLLCGRIFYGKGCSSKWLD